MQHGGHIDIDDSNMEWLYNEAIKADVAVLSVATTSRSHPRQEVIRSLRLNDTHVKCSQISSRCTTKPTYLERKQWETLSNRRKHAERFAMRWLASLHFAHQLQLIR